ncbi:MAG: lysylphosphatidylglycerol synthase domain-containing protein, partial [Acidimicrobiales bacterium]
GWARALSLLGLATPALLHRRFLAGVLDVARRFVRRIPAADRLPSQRAILSFYAWAVVSIGCTAGAYTVLLRSLSEEAGSATVVVAYAMSWTIGFMAVPLPAGIGVREAVLVACLPAVGTAPLLAASLAHRLLAIGAELIAASGSKVAARARSLPDAPAQRVEEVKSQ